MQMMNPILIRSLIAGLITSFLCAVIGVFVVVRKMSFFAHAVSHSALTGVAIGYLLNLNPFAFAIGFGLLTGLSVSYLVEKSKLFTDTVIGILLPFTMSIGLILLSFVKGYKPDVMSYLFGDILATNISDIFIIVFVGLFSLVLVFALFKQFVLLSIDRDYGEIRGYRVELLDYTFMFLVSLIVLLSTKIVGIILVSALVVIPSATAIKFASNLKQTFIISVVVGVLGTILGIVFSFSFNLPTGPSIVTVISLIFLLSFLYKKG